MREFYPLEFALSALSRPALYIVVLAACVSIVAKLVYRPVGIVEVFLYYLLVGMPMGLVGFATGFLTGMSRSPAVGNVLPAVLALIAGFNIYIFGTDNRYKLVAAYCVCVFMLMMFIGIETGAFEREAEHETRLKLLSEEELRIRTFRNNLDLSPDMPDWILDKDSKK